MATREERTAAYRRVVMALIKAATMDAYVERTAIAKAMDALGPVIADIDPSLVHLAVAFRNGPLLGDLYHPVSTYLQKEPDPRPVSWVFTTAEVLSLIRCNMDVPENAYKSIGDDLLRAAYRLIGEHTATSLIGYDEGRWCGTLEAKDGRFVVTLYPDVNHPRLPADALRYMNPDRPKPKTPPGLLPTILVGFGELLGAVDVENTIEFTIIDYAHARLKYHKPEQFRKLTKDWWAEVEVTDLGYLVTFHYDREMP